MVAEVVYFVFVGCRLSAVVVEFFVRYSLFGSICRVV
jgi:hypothetical protein